MAQGVIEQIRVYYNEIGKYHFAKWYFLYIIESIEKAFTIIVNERVFIMTTIVNLFCSAGMSTSLFAQKMQKEAEARGLDFEIKAYGLAEVDTEGPKADVILIGPQARYMVSEVAGKFPDTPVKDIPMQMYGLMQGDKGLDLALELLN